MKLSTIIVAFMLVSSLVSSATAGNPGKDERQQPLTLKLSTHLAPAPAQVTARINVMQDTRSRSLLVEWWQEEGLGGSHEVTLEGDRAAARQDFAIRSIVAGSYVVRVVLTRNDGTTVERQSNLIVVD